jgi:protein TonB
MTAQFRVALGTSVGLHALALVGWPGVAPVVFDVERAPTSVEIRLVRPAPQPRVTRAPEDPQPPQPPEPEPEPTAAPEQAPQTILADDTRGARTDLLPSYLRNPSPVYPELARAQGDEGTVLLDVHVLPSGRCGEIRVLASSGHALLDEAAVRAVRGWVFKPATRWRQPIPFRVEIPITFRLVDGEARAEKVVTNLRNRRSKVSRQR